MIVWFSYNQLFCSLLAKYLPFKLMSGHSSLFGDSVPKGDVGGSELSAQRQLLFNTCHSTVPQVGYCAGATHALCSAHRQPWLVVVILDSAPTQLDGSGVVSISIDRSGTSLTAHSIAIAIHLQTDSVYYIDVPPLPIGWRYARLVDINRLSKVATEHPYPTPQQQLSAAADDDSIVEPCNGDIIDVVALLATYALSCQLLVLIPSLIEHTAQHDRSSDTDTGKGHSPTLAQLHAYNNNMLTAITTLVDQRYAQLATP